MAGARSREGTQQKVWGGVEKKHFVLNFALRKAPALLRKMYKQLTIRAQYVRHTHTHGKHSKFSARRETIQSQQLLSLLFKLSLSLLFKLSVCSCITCNLQGKKNLVKILLKLFFRLFGNVRITKLVVSNNHLNI